MDNGLSKLKFLSIPISKFIKIKRFNSDQVGRLTIALIDYIQTGEKNILVGETKEEFKLEYLFDELIDDVNYSAKCAKEKSESNRDKALKRWESNSMQQDAIACNDMLQHATGCNSIQQDNLQAMDAKIKNKDKIKSKSEKENKNESFVIDSYSKNLCQQLNPVDLVGVIIELNSLYYHLGKEPIKKLNEDCIDLLNDCLRLCNEKGLNFKNEVHKSLFNFWTTYSKLAQNAKKEEIPKHNDKYYIDIIKNDIKQNLPL